MTWQLKRKFWREKEFRRQRPIKDRWHAYVGLEPRVRDGILELARRTHTYPSIVESTLLADALGIDLDPRDRFDSKPAHVKPGKAE